MSAFLLNELIYCQWQWSYHFFSGTGPTFINFASVLKWSPVHCSYRSLCLLKKFLKVFVRNVLPRPIGIGTFCLFVMSIMWTW